MEVPRRTQGTRGWIKQRKRPTTTAECADSRVLVLGTHLIKIERLLSLSRMRSPPSLLLTRFPCSLPKDYKLEFTHNGAFLGGTTGALGQRHLLDKARQQQVVRCHSGPLQEYHAQPNGTPTATPTYNDRLGNLFRTMSLSENNSEPLTTLYTDIYTKIHSVVDEYDTPLLRDQNCAVRKETVPVDSCEDIMSATNRQEDWTVCLFLLDQLPS
ncbi:MAG: hypothetical protein J3Q66DRAFT_129820 [Benniella sp.]|nr:MAG: hypothetical protein J3Q66DRAFT_129820 [Benniella sp.]